MPDSQRLLDSKAIANARQASALRREELHDVLSKGMGKYSSDDTSVVVFGSLGRDEWTSGSDLDWTLLVDGVAKPEHIDIAQKVQRIIHESKDRFPAPGTTGTFGNMAFSHDIVHRIGGQNDTNKNTTQRILLLQQVSVRGLQRFS